MKSNQTTSIFKRISAASLFAFIASTLLIRQGSAQPASEVNKMSQAATTSTATTTTTITTSSPVTPTDSGPVFPATSHEQALFNARKGAGRSDPLGPITGFKPFPSNVPVLQKTVELKQNLAPAPVKFGDLLGKTVLPPPPPVALQTDLPVSELPLPPDRPSIMAKLKLTGIIGDKAIFALTDKDAIRVNKWPGVIMMAAGDRFESIRTLTVGTDSAVLEEDGERSTKTLERIR